MTRRGSAAAQVGYGGPERLFGVTGLGVDGTVAHGAMRLAPATPGADDRPAEGALGVLVDDVLGYAAVAVAPPGHWSVRTDIALDLTGDWWDATGLLTAQARTVYPRPFTGRRDVRYTAVLRHGGRSFAVLDVTGAEAGRTGTLAQVTAHPAG